MRYTIKRPLLALLLFACVIRLLYWTEHANSPFFGVPLLDQKYYHLFAQRLARGEDVSNFAGFRPMLYPLFLSLPYRMAGDLGIALAIFAQHLLGIGTTLMTALIARRLFKSLAAGIAAGAIYALAAPPLYFEGEILITSLLTFLVIVTMLMLAYAVAGEGRSRRAARLFWLAAGGVTGLAAQARPNVLVFLPFFLLSSLYLLTRRSNRQWTGPALALTGAVAVMVIFGFINASQSGRFQLVTGAGGVNLYLGNCRTADGIIPRQPESVTYDGEYKDSIQVFAEQQYRNTMMSRGTDVSSNPSDVSRFWVRETVREITAAPGHWCGLMLRKAWFLLWNRESANNKTFSFIVQEESRLLGLLPVTWWFLVCLVPVGLWASVTRGNRFLAVIIISFVALYGGGIVLFFVNARFRIPLWPLLSVFAGGALCALAQAARQRQWRRLLVFGAVMSVMAAVSCVNWFGMPQENYARDFFFRSKAHYAKGNYDAAVSDAKRSVELDADNPDPWFQLGCAYLAIGDNDAARVVFERLTSVDPKEVRVWNNLGATYEGLGMYSDAYNAYQTALGLSPNHVRTVLNTLLLELRAGQYEKAALRLDHARRLAPNLPETLFALSVVKRKEGDDLTADAALEAARRRAPALLERLEQDQRSAIPGRSLEGSAGSM